MSRSSTKTSKAKLTSKANPNRKPPPRPASGASRPPARRASGGLRRVAPWLAVAGVAAIVLAGLAVFRGSSGEESAAAAGSFVGGDLHSLVVDPTQPDRLFVGGHQAVATSRDGGRSWEQVPSLREADAMGWAFLDGAVWMGGHPGLRRSTDGGATFAPVGGQLQSTDVHALGGGGGVLYAASPGRGLLASADNGASWELRSSAVGKGFMGGIVVDPADVEHLFAPDMQAGVMESRDGGRSWRTLGSPGMAMSVTAVDGDVSELVVAGNGSAARSTDGGATWNAIDVPEDTMVVAAGGEGKLYAAALDGTVANVSVSTDGGATWEPLDAGSQ